MIFGYARVSTQDQLLDRQLDQLKSAGCEKILQEKITGTKKERPELNKLFEQVRAGDVIIVSDLSRLSRSTKDLFLLVEKFDKMGVNLKSLKETWLDTTTPQGRFMFTVCAGVNQFERDLASQRTKEGLEAARLRGRKGGRPFKETKDIELAVRMYDSKTCSVSDITKATGVSRSCLYEYLKERK